MIAADDEYVYSFTIDVDPRHTVLWYSENGGPMVPMLDEHGDQISGNQPWLPGYIEEAKD